MRRPLSFIALLLFVCSCSESIEGPPPVDYAQLIQEKYKTELAAGDPAKLDQIFDAVTNEGEKEALAVMLMNDDRNDRYAAYLKTLARQVVQDNPPFPFRVRFGQLSDSVTTEFRDWCAAHNISTAEGLELLMVRQPLRLLYLDREDIPLLMKALRHRNWVIVETAAQRLQDLNHTAAIPEMAAAAHRAPFPFNAEIAQAIGYFDTPEAWKHVEELKLPSEIELGIRTKVSESKEEERRSK